MDKRFRDLDRARVAMETGTHSIWVSEQIQELGHEVIVANVRELRAISHSDRKSDKVDAEKIARYARLDPEILRPISHRTVAQQETLTLIRARDALVRLRTGAVNSVRGLAKPCGYRLPASSTLTFAKRCLAVLPPVLAQALGPLLQQIADMTVKIKRYDREIQKLHPCGPVGLLARKLEGDNNNAIPGNRAAGGVGSGLKFCGHDGSLGGLV